MKDASVLLVDDDQDAVLSLQRALRARGLTAKLQAATGREAALEIAAAALPEVVLLDLCLQESAGVESGFSLLRALLDADPTCRIIVLTGNGSIEYGVRSLQQGAASFVEKPADLDHLQALILDGIRQSRLRRAYEEVRNKEEQDVISSLIIGTSPAIKEVLSAVRYAGQTSQSVLLVGETGTGKGLCAAAIHKAGPRRERNFIRFQPHFGNPDLVQSDLFGHAANAFTGAVKERRGLLAEADGGTIFLDEVDELPLQTQVTLLGVLQEKRFRPVGANIEQPLDARFIAATNRDVGECLHGGKLRNDFYHRIAHFTIELPPLRERMRDVPLLAAAVLKRLREREQLHVFGLNDAALSVLQSYDWPGNVRELEAAVEGAAYMAQYRGTVEIAAEDIRCGRSCAGPSPGTLSARVAEYKQKLVREALGQNNGNQIRAARALGIDRTTLRRILNREQQ